MKIVWTWGAALMAAGVLAACGGNDGDGYGSVAVSATTNRVAISSGRMTQSVANDAARDECDADDCKVVLQFEECGAAAQGVLSGALLITAGEGNTAFRAQSAAIEACTASGATACNQIPNIEAKCN